MSSCADMLQNGTNVAAGQPLSLEPLTSFPTTLLVVAVFEEVLVVAIGNGIVALEELRNSLRFD